MMAKGVFPDPNGGWPTERLCKYCGCRLTRAKGHEGKWNCDGPCKLISTRITRNGIYYDEIFEGISIWNPKSENYTQFENYRRTEM